MERRDLPKLLRSLAALAAPLLLIGAGEAPRKPNIVIILADDLGYADVGVQGGTEMSTPHIDSLARDGVRFTNGYVSGPVCAPARAGLLTGRYQARFGYENETEGVIVQVSTDRGVSTDEILLPQYLKEAGYETGAIGKWHLGYNQKYRPNRRGFDYFFGFLPGGHSYFEWRMPERGMRIYRNGDFVDGEGYLTEAFTREAVGFIRANRARPFFLYLAYFNVHRPLVVPEKYTRGLPAKLPEKRRKMIGMVQALDQGVGEVLAALRDAGLEDDTLVIFLGDNGGIGRGIASNAPLARTKATLYEGGIRVPFMLRWPGRVPAGETYDAPVIALDLVPTVVTLAGGSLPSDREIDGVDILPYVTGARSGSPHEVLFWRFGRRGESLAVRRGDMKLLIHEGKRPRLFDLSADIGEKKNLAAAKPEVVVRLLEELTAWNAKMPDVPW
jgi:arylsulfatase A-like enzyme